MISIPNYKKIDILYIVCDYNGTIAKDGEVLPEIDRLFELLSMQYKIYVITADTFGSVKMQMKNSNCEVVILSSDNHTEEKAEFIKKLGIDNCVAIGNGNNDKKMLQSAVLSFAIIGEEGCSKDALLAADIVSKDIVSALELLINKKRLIATLRR